MYDSEAYFNRGARVDIDFDASARGIDILRVDDRCISYVADPLSGMDYAKCQFEPGDCEGHQTWERFATLVALGLWLAHWKHVRVCLRVRSDSTTALQLLLTLKASGRSPTLIGKELALGIARGSYRPNVAPTLARRGKRGA